jgi:hypothetical protein
LQLAFSCRAPVKGWSIQAPSEPPEPGLPGTNGRVQVEVVAFANTLEHETSSDPLADMRSIEIIFHSVPPVKKNLIVRLRFAPEFALSSLQSGTI